MPFLYRNNNTVAAHMLSWFGGALSPRNFEINGQFGAVWCII